MKLVTNKFKSGGLHEKHVVATWNIYTYIYIYMCVCVCVCGGVQVMSFEVTRHTQCDP